MHDNYNIVSNIENIPDLVWETINDYENVNFFQTKRAVNFFKNHGFDVICVAVLKDSKIKAILSAVVQKEQGLQSYFSRRAIVFGGPVFSNDVTSKEVDLLLSEVKKEIKGKAIYLETRNFNDYSKFKDAFIKNGFNYNPHLNFHLDARDEEVARKNVSKNKFRYIKKSLKSGVEIIEAENERQVLDYYVILEDLYKNKVKTPLADSKFFIDLFNQKTAKFLLLKYEDKIIGGTVITELDKKVVYEWYVCGNDDEYKALRPSTLATWAVIDYAIKNGIDRFDFMGAGKPDEAYGVRDFKASFGGELVEHGRFVYVVSPFLYWLGTKAVKIKKKL